MREAVERDGARRFSAGQRFQILLSHSTDGIARCAACDEIVAILSPDGTWLKQRPIEYNHIEPHAHGGRTEAANGEPVCGHPHDCHKKITAAQAASDAKVSRMAGETGQYARRQARKAAGKRPLIPAHHNAWGKR